MIHTPFRELVRRELSSIEYCCYCFEPKGCKYHCCQENHFVPFTDLYPEDQEDILNNELEEYEGMNK